MRKSSLSNFVHSAQKRGLDRAVQRRMVLCIIPIQDERNKIKILLRSRGEFALFKDMITRSLRFLQAFRFIASIWGFSKRFSLH